MLVLGAVQPADLPGDQRPSTASPELLDELFGACDPFDPCFAIVTP